MSAALDAAAREWLQKSATEGDGDEEQRRLQKAASKWLGALASGNAQRRRPLRELCEIVCGGIMAADAMIDAGAILALLDRTDRWHGVCVEAFHQLRLPLVTSEAGLTELFHLVKQVS